MLHGGNHTCRDPFTYSVSHKDTAVGTKISDFDSSDQGTDIQILLVFLGPSKSLLIGVLE
jgi:hypothetical protein